MSVVFESVKYVGVNSVRRAVRFRESYLTNYLHPGELVRGSLVWPEQWCARAIKRGPMRTQQRSPNGRSTARFGESEHSHAHLNMTRQERRRYQGSWRGPWRVARQQRWRRRRRRRGRRRGRVVRLEGISRANDASRSSACSAAAAAVGKTDGEIGQYAAGGQSHAMRASGEPGGSSAVPVGLVAAEMAIDSAPCLAALGEVRRETALYGWRQRQRKRRGLSRGPMVESGIVRPHIGRCKKG